MRRHLSVVGVLGVAVLAIAYGALGVPLTLGSSGPADTGSLADTPGGADSNAGAVATTTPSSPTTTTSTGTETTTTASATTSTSDDATTRQSTTTTADGATTTTATTQSGSSSGASSPSDSSSSASASEADNADETTNASSGDSADGSNQAGEHYVIVAGGSPSNIVDYQLTASGDVTPSEGQPDWPVSADSVSFDPEDSVDGRTASGTLGGGADAFWYDGDLTCFEVSDPDAVTVYVDGESVPVGSVAGGADCDGGSGDGSDASGGDSDSSDGDSSNGGAAASGEVNVSFPSCTEVRIDGLEDSEWQVEYVSMSVWLLDDWTRDGPPPIDTHMIGLPQNDTGPVYTYENDSLVRGDLYIIDGVTLVSPDGDHVEWTNPHDCEFVVGVSDNGTVSEPRNSSANRSSALLRG